MLCPGWMHRMHGRSLEGKFKIFFMFILLEMVIKGFLDGLLFKR